MKKIISFLGSISLLASSSVWVSSCSTLNAIHHGCYDENWWDKTDENSDVNQWVDIFLLSWCLSSLSKDLFVDSDSFYQLDGKTSIELLQNYFRDSNGDKFDDDAKFNYDFIFLITNYDSISAPVVEQMSEMLQDKETGTYLFLNLPLNKRTSNIQDEPRVDFQFVFLIKNSSGKITNNENNDWIYWYDEDNINRLDPNHKKKYFFDFFTYAAYRRVITQPLIWPKVF